jgi:hypothetical protein
LKSPQRMALRFKGCVMEWRRDKRMSSWASLSRPRRGLKRRCVVAIQICAEGAMVNNFNLYIAERVGYCTHDREYILELQ